jgi:hypothetical protein
MICGHLAGHAIAELSALSDLAAAPPGAEAQRSRPEVTGL